MAATSTLHVIIDPEDVERFQRGESNLCLTRDVSFNEEVTKGNMVFSAVLSKDLGPDITFQWKERYQIYGITGLKQPPINDPDAIVKTETATIEAGQEATLTANGRVNVLGSSVGGQPFHIHNTWKDPARTAVKIYDSIDHVFSPIFTSPEVPNPSTTKLLPVQSYSVFFDHHLVTGAMMWDKTTTPPFRFSFGGNSAITVSYKAGLWAVVR